MLGKCVSNRGGYATVLGGSAGSVVAMKPADYEQDLKPRRHLSEQEAADHLGVLSVRTLQDWRRKGTGPAYFRLGRRVAYSVVDLDAFLAAARVAPKVLVKDGDA